MNRKGRNKQTNSTYATFKDVGLTVLFAKFNRIISCLHPGKGIDKEPLIEGQETNLTKHDHFVLAPKASDCVLKVPIRRTVSSVITYLWFSDNE